MGSEQIDLTLGGQARPSSILRSGVTGDSNQVTGIETHLLYVWIDLANHCVGVLKQDSSANTARSGLVELSTC